MGTDDRHTLEFERRVRELRDENARLRAWSREPGSASRTETGRELFGDRGIALAVLESMADGVIVHGRDGAILACNAGAERILDLTTHELLGGSSLDTRWRTLRPDGSSLPVEEWPSRVTLRTGQPCNDVVVGLERPDGIRTWISVNTRPLVRSGQSTVEAVVVSFSDITVLKRNEERLLQIAHGVANNTGPTFFASLVEYLAEALGAGIAFVGELSSGSDSQIRVIAGHADGRPMKPFEYLLRDTPCETLIDGLYCEYNGDVQERFPRDRLLQEMAITAYFGTPLLDSEGRTIGIMVVLAHSPLTDTSVVESTLRIFASRASAELDRLRAENLLEASEARLSGIIGSAMDAIIAVDDTQRIVMFNAAAEQMFGCPATEAIGIPIDRFIPEKFRASHQEHVRRFGRTGETSRRMGRLQPISGLRSDGTEFPVEASISKTAEGGKTVYTVILRDNSERKRLQEQLLQAQKMESIGRLAGGVAHDFNNLLTAILGYTELGVSELDGDHAVQAYLERVREASERGAALTGQLLAFARKQVIEPRIVRLDAIIDRVETMLGRIIGEDIRLETRISLDVLAVRADPVQLEQVLINLAVNARDAMPGGGTLSLDVDHVTIARYDAEWHEGVRAGEYVRAAVGDTGIGMDDETKRRLFEPFFTTKGPGEGTGLGLAMCYGIVKQSAGHILVDSAPGRGSQFSILLPRIEPAAETETHEAPGSEPPTGSETILLAEDETMVRGILLRILRGLGYTVIEAPDGESALAAARAHRGTIDLLLTDVIMPGLGGQQLTERVRVERPGIRVLYISGYTDSAVVPREIREGGAAFLQKPFTPHAVANRVRDVLDVGEIDG